MKTGTEERGIGWKKTKKCIKVLKIQGYSSHSLLFPQTKTLSKKPSDKGRVSTRCSHPVPEQKNQPKSGNIFPDLFDVRCTLSLPSQLNYSLESPRKCICHKQNKKKDEEEISNKITSCGSRDMHLLIQSAKSCSCLLLLLALVQTVQTHWAQRGT